MLTHAIQLFIRSFIHPSIQSDLTLFQDWREVTPLTFSKATSSTSDLNIRFVSYDHGDGFPFDGRGLFVGHTFLPESGEVHLDDSELWTNGTEYYNDGAITNFHVITYY